MTVKTIIEYTDPLQHMYNPSDVEVSAGRAKLASKVLASELAFFNFDVDGSALAKRGGLTINLPDFNSANLSSAIVQNGWLEMKGNDLTYGLLTNIPKIADGTNLAFRSKIRVNFASIGPQYNIVKLTNNENSAEVLFYFQNQGGGVTRVRATVRDDANTIFYNGILGSRTFAVDSVIEIGFSRDVTSGDYYLILDGARINVGAMTFTMDTLNVELGGPYAFKTNWSYDDIQIWNGVERPVLDIGSISPEDTTYSTGIANYLITTAPFLMDKFVDFGEMAERFNGTDIKYLFLINTDMHWHDGTSWTLSNGSFLESNTIVEILANLSTIPIAEGVGAYITLQAVLFSTNGYDTPILESNHIDYSFYFQNGGSNVCAVYGNVVDNCGKGIEGAKITVDSPDYIKGNDLVGPSCSTTTNANGRWSLGIIETQTTAKTVTITISYPKTELVFGQVEFEDVVYNNVTIPNETSKSFGDLINP